MTENKKRSFGSKWKKKVADEKLAQSVMTLHYPHSTPFKTAEWKEDYYQVTGIDPAVSTHLLLITERRHFRGKYIGVVEQLDIRLVDFSKSLKEGKSMQCLIASILDSALDLYMNSHFILSEEVN